MQLCFGVSFFFFPAGFKPFEKICLSIVYFGTHVETRGCVNKLILNRGDMATNTLDLTGELGFAAAPHELRNGSWIETAMMRVVISVPDGNSRRFVCELDAQTSIKLNSTIIKVNVTKSFSYNSSKNHFVRKPPSQRYN